MTLVVDGVRRGNAYLYDPEDIEQEIKEELEEDPHKFRKSWLEIEPTRLNSYEVDEWSDYCETRYERRTLEIRLLRKRLEYNPNLIFSRTFREVLAARKPYALTDEEKKLRIQWFFATYHDVELGVRIRAVASKAFFVGSPTHLWNTQDLTHWIHFILTRWAERMNRVFPYQLLEAYFTNVFMTTYKKEFTILTFSPYNERGRVLRAEYKKRKNKKYWAEKGYKKQRNSDIQHFY
jgi:hypothetical protein